MNYNRHLKQRCPNFCIPLYIPGLYAGHGVPFNRCHTVHEPTPV
uniref:Uncharacterized protein n=1 Tax=Anguilla anguilla TaxID=7936 RepID=A0A0E9SCL7_ANGAN